MVTGNNQSRSTTSKMAEVAQSPRSDRFGIASACQSKIHKDELTHHKRCCLNDSYCLGVWRAVCRSAHRNSMLSSASSAQNSQLCSTLDLAVHVTLPGSAR